LYDELIDRCIDGSIQSIEERTEKFQTPNRRRCRVTSVASTTLTSNLFAFLWSTQPPQHSL
jgi:hypothetical protein